MCCNPWTGEGRTVYRVRDVFHVLMGRTFVFGSYKNPRNLKKPLNL